MATGEVPISTKDEIKYQSHCDICDRNTLIDDMKPLKCSRHRVCGRCFIQVDKQTRCIMCLTSTPRSKPKTIVLVMESWDNIMNTTSTVGCDIAYWLVKLNVQKNKIYCIVSREEGSDTYDAQHKGVTLFKCDTDDNDTINKIKEELGVIDILIGFVPSQLDVLNTIQDSLNVNKSIWIVTDSGSVTLVDENCAMLFSLGLNVFQSIESLREGRERPPHRYFIPSPAEHFEVNILMDLPERTYIAFPLIIEETTSCYLRQHGFYTGISAIEKYVRFGNANPIVILLLRDSPVNEHYKIFETLQVDKIQYSFELRIEKINGTRQWVEKLRQASLALCTHSNAPFNHWIYRLIDMNIPFLVSNVSEVGQILSFSHPFAIVQCHMDEVNNWCNSISDVLQNVDSRRIDHCFGKSSFAKSNKEGYFPIVTQILDLHDLEFRTANNNADPQVARVADEIRERFNDLTNVIMEPNFLNISKKCIQTKCESGRTLIRTDFDTEKGMIQLYRAFKRLGITILTVDEGSLVFRVVAVNPEEVFELHELLLDLINHYCFQGKVPHNVPFVLNINGLGKGDLFKETYLNDVAECPSHAGNLAKATHVMDKISLDSGISCTTVSSQSEQENRHSLHSTEETKIVDSVIGRIESITKNPEGSFEPVAEQGDQFNTDEEILPYFSTPKESLTDYQIVVALDFGTSTSGYAWSTKDQSDVIKMNKPWESELSTHTDKTPTAVLTDNNKDFVAFGYEAKRMYSENPDIYHLYDQKFKMKLWHAKELWNEEVISRNGGQNMKLLLLITMTIRYLYSHMLKELETSKISVEEARIRVVLSVPGVWCESAKNFMRTAACGAGIESTRLILALESETASLFCRTLQPTTLRSYKTMPISSPIGTEYMVLDCGGGVVELSGHTVEEVDLLKEIYPATGGPWGGDTINEKFDELLYDLLGKSFIKNYQLKKPLDWLNIETNIELIKRTFTEGADQSITFPISLIKAYESQTWPKKNLAKHITKRDKEGFEFKDQVLCIKTHVIVKMFESNITRIVSHVISNLEQIGVGSLKYLYMVGSFSACQLLFQSVTKAIVSLNSDIQVLRPIMRDLASLKGGIYFGHRPYTISSRLSRLTYGTDIEQLFDPQKHEPSKKTINNGEERCKDIFQVWARKNERIAAGDKRSFKIYPHIESSGTSCVSIYSTDKEKVMYTTDPGVSRLARVQLNMSNCDKTIHEKGVTCEVYFGGTELKITCVDKSRSVGTSLNSTITFNTSS